MSFASFVIYSNLVRSSHAIFSSLTSPSFLSYFLVLPYVTKFSFYYYWVAIAATELILVATIRK